VLLLLVHQQQHHVVLPDAEKLRRVVQKAADPASLAACFLLDSAGE
jgi:hypothetical protein